MMNDHLDVLIRNLTLVISRGNICPGTFTLLRIVTELSKDDVIKLKDPIDALIKQLDNAWSQCQEELITQILSMILSFVERHPPIQEYQEQELGQRQRC